MPTSSIGCTFSTIFAGTLLASCTPSRCRTRSRLFRRVDATARLVDQHCGRSFKSMTVRSTVRNHRGWIDALSLPHARNLLVGMPTDSVLDWVQDFFLACPFSVEKRAQTATGYGA